MASQALLYLVSHWWSAFVLTFLIELPIYAWLPRSDAAIRRRLLGGALATAVTHPLLWFVWRPLTTGVPFAIPLAELLICLVEAVVFFAVARPISFRQALAVSLIANGASYGIGLLINFLF